MGTSVFKQLVTIKEKLQEYHGATKLQNIPEIISSELYQTLMVKNMVSSDQTVSKTIEEINTTLSLDSEIFQFKRFQEQSRDNHIIPSQKMSENQRLKFNEGKNLYEYLQTIFSNELYYFIINPARFKKNDTAYNN